MDKINAFQKEKSAELKNVLNTVKNADSIGGKIMAAEAGVKTLMNSAKESVKTLKEITKESIENTLSKVLNEAPAVVNSQLKVLQNNKNVSKNKKGSVANVQPDYKRVKGEEVSYIYFDNRLI